MLELTEDLDYNETICCAMELLDFVIEKYNIKRIDDFTCPFMKALAKQMYWETE